MLKMADLETQNLMNDVIEDEQQFAYVCNEYLQLREIIFQELIRLI